MFISNIDTQAKSLTISLPLTSPTGKIRVKERTGTETIGWPIATRQKRLNKNCYVEWQVSYTMNQEKTELLKDISTKHLALDKGNKVVAELGEYIYHFHKWGVIKTDELLKMHKFIESCPEEELISESKQFVITREKFVKKDILGVEFFASHVKHPLLIYKFDEYELLLEIILTEKQRAVGIQPMLYFCLPIEKLQCDPPIIGRIANPKETADFTVGKNEVRVLLKMLEIFGVLSPNHRTDVLNIIELLTKKSQSHPK